MLPRPARSFSGRILAITPQGEKRVSMTPDTTLFYPFVQCTSLSGKSEK